MGQTVGMLAYDYPMLNVFVTMLWFFLFIVWIMILFHVFGDIFRSRDLSGWAKALWSIFIIFLPFLGVLVYVIARGDSMRTHAVQDAQARDAAFKGYVQQVTSSTDTSGQLAQLAALRDAGTITEADFQAGKAKILG
jgi:hypothetical protein